MWHHKRRTRRLPYSAHAYLVQPGRKPFEVIEAGNCDEAGTEGEAARDALRALQEALGDGDGALGGEILRRALLDPLEAISERLVVG